MSPFWCPTSKVSNVILPKKFARNQSPVPVLWIQKAEQTQRALHTKWQACCCVWQNSAIPSKRVDFDSVPLSFLRWLLLFFSPNLFYLFFLLPFYFLDSFDSNRLFMIAHKHTLNRQSFLYLLDFRWSAVQCAMSATLSLEYKKRFCFPIVFCKFDIFTSRANVLRSFDFCAASFTSYERKYQQYVLNHHIYS